MRRRQGFVAEAERNRECATLCHVPGRLGNGRATSIAVDAAGAAFVGGWTASDDFPTANPLQGDPRGQRDAFVAKLEPSGARLAYATRLGGRLDDAINAIAVDDAGNAYVAGETYSADFPVKAAFQSVKAGARLINSSTGSAFVAKLSASGNALVYSSFLGGEVCQTLCQVAIGSLPQYRADAAYGIAVDASGHAYVTGIARSVHVSARRLDVRTQAGGYRRLGVRREDRPCRGHRCCGRRSYARASTRPTTSGLVSPPVPRPVSPSIRPALHSSPATPTGSATSSPQAGAFQRPTATIRARWSSSSPVCRR
jgi:hypothetical protein